MKCSNEEEHKMKKTNIARLSALALTLCLASTALMSGTMAKYTTTVTGNGTATVAKWNFKVNNGTQNFTVNLGDTLNYSNVATKTIAPGTEGSFDIELDATGSDTAVDYEIAFGNLTNKPENLKFCSDQACGTVIDLTDPDKAKVSGNIGLSNKPVTKTIYWKWAYDGSDTAPITGNEKMSFTITVTGTQSTPTTPAV